MPNSIFTIQLCGEGAVYLTSPGIQLILAYNLAGPAILVAGKGRGGMFLFLLFLHFHSCTSFFLVLLFHFLYYLVYLFSPFLWETTKNVSLNPNTIILTIQFSVPSSDLTSTKICRRCKWAAVGTISHCRREWTISFTTAVAGTPCGKGTCEPSAGFFCS